MKTLFFVLIASLSLCAAPRTLTLLDGNDPKSYGTTVRLYQPTPYGGFGDEQHRLRITRNGKVVKEWKDFSIKPLYTGDLDNDGYTEVAILEHSGGMLCCFEIYIIRIRPEGIRISWFQFFNAVGARAKDLDGDGRVEIVSLDDIYYNDFGMSPGDSPDIEVVFNIEKDDTPHLRPALMKRYTKPHYYDHFTSDGPFFLTDKMKNYEVSASTELIETVLFLMYTGEAAKAIKAMVRYARFDKDFDVNETLQRLIESMSHSIFWPDICAVNGWCKASASSMKGRGVCEPLEGKAIIRTLRFAKEVLMENP